MFQTETTNQQIKEVQKKTHTEEFEFPGSRSEQGYDSVATVHLAHEYEIVNLFSNWYLQLYLDIILNPNHCIDVVD